MKFRDYEPDQKVKELLQQVELVDAEEDRFYGKGVRGDKFPEEVCWKLRWNYAPNKYYDNVG